jgi:hypothetical protein
MPRSGTPLVEQILASHPQVSGAGELNLFERSVGDVRSAIQEAPAYPEIARHMAAEHFQELGGRYLAGIQQLAHGAWHRVLPPGRILDVERDTGSKADLCQFNRTAARLRAVAGASARGASPLM